MLVILRRSSTYMQSRDDYELDRMRTSSSYEPMVEQGLVSRPAEHIPSTYGPEWIWIHSRRKRLPV